MSPAPDPPPVPAVECWAISYPQAVNCSWGLATEPLLDTDFVATYRSVGGPEHWLSPPVPVSQAGLRQGSCPRPSDPLCPPRHGVSGAAETGECVRTGPRSCSFGDVQMFSLTPYVVNVTAVNPLGAASSLLPFLLENISECWGPRAPHPSLAGGGSDPAGGLAPLCGSETLGGGSAHLRSSARGAGGRRAPVPRHVAHTFAACPLR